MLDGEAQQTDEWLLPPPSTRPLQGAFRGAAEDLKWIRLLLDFSPVSLLHFF